MGIRASVEKVSLARRASAPVGLGMWASCVALVRTAGRSTRPNQRSLAAKGWRALGSANADESGGESGSGVMVAA